MKANFTKVTKVMIWLVSVSAAALMLTVLFLLWLGSQVSCDSDNTNEDHVDTLCTCPFVQISLQPMGDFTQAEASRLKKELEQHLAPMLADVAINVDVLPNKPLVGSLLNDEHTRYRADKIINSLAQAANSQRIIVGLTHKDISVSYKGKADWGVLGLSLIPKKACAVSTYRLKRHKDLWKVVTHEFIHTYFQYKHCPEDNPVCIMKDAKGHADFSQKNTLCSACQKELLKRI